MRLKEDEIYRKLEEFIDLIIPQFKTYLQTVTIPDSWKKRKQTINELDERDRLRNEYKEIYPNFLVRRKWYTLEWSAYGGDSELTYIMMGFSFRDRYKTEIFEDIIELIVKKYGKNINKIDLSWNFSDPERGVSEFLYRFVNFILLKIKYNELTEELKREYIKSLIDDFALKPKEFLSIQFIETISGTKEKYNIYDKVELKKFDATDFEVVVQYNIFINPIKIEHSKYVLKFSGIYNKEEELKKLEDDVLFVLRLYKLSTIYFTERWSFKKSILDDNFFFRKKQRPKEIIGMHITDEEKTSFEIFTNELIEILRNLRRKSNWIFIEHMLESYGRAILSLDDYYHRIKYAVVGYDPIFRMDSKERTIKTNITRRMTFLMSYFNYDIEEIKQKFGKAYSRIRSAKSHMGVIKNFTKEELKEMLSFLLNVLRKSIIVYLLNFKENGRNFAGIIDEAMDNPNSKKEFDTFIQKILNKYKSILID